MINRIYDFLDRVVGREVNCTMINNGRSYVIVSTKGYQILEFVIINKMPLEKGRIAIFRSKTLTDMVSSFFGIHEQDAANIIKYWFGDVHKLEKVGDIVKFIPPNIK